MHKKRCWHGYRTLLIESQTNGHYQRAIQEKTRMNEKQGVLVYAKTLFFIKT